MKQVLLAPLARVYAAVLHAKNARYDRGATQRLGWPVVSVGNLSTGGAGKTPLVVLVAQQLAQSGWRPDILSRGYGRSSRRTERVDPSGDTRRFGDEPIMIARATEAPVFVGASRYEAGLLAEREQPAGQRHVHLLDDGFQHRQLARTVDVVAIHRDDLADRLLPAGRLREPLSSLTRADVIALREEDADLAPQLASYTKPGAGFWRVRRRLALAVDSMAAQTSGPTSAIAFCALARPKEFFQMLEEAGVTLAGRRAFRDHHRYTRRDVEELRKLGERSGAAAFVTTEKDAVKLDAGLKEALGALHVAQLSVELADGPEAIARLVAMLDQRSGSGTQL